MCFTVKTAKRIEVFGHTKTVFNSLQANYLFILLLIR
jgi:hypothetical protein